MQIPYQEFSLSVTKNKFDGDTSVNFRFGNYPPPNFQSSQQDFSGLLINAKHVMIPYSLT